MEKIDKELGLKIVELSRRVSSAFIRAIPSDFYSRNGKTWDGKADGASEFAKQTDEYHFFLSGEAQRAENSVGELSDLSEQLQQFIIRVETRARATKLIPLARTYQTVFSIDGKTTNGTHFRSELDITTLSEDELLELVPMLEEATQELIFRDFSNIEENTNKTNK